MAKGPGMDAGRVGRGGKITTKRMDTHPCLLGAARSLRFRKAPQCRTLYSQLVLNPERTLVHHATGLFDCPLAVNIQSKHFLLAVEQKMCKGGRGRGSLTLRGASSKIRSVRARLPDSAGLKDTEARQSAGGAAREMAKVRRAAAGVWGFWVVRWAPRALGPA